MASNLSEGIAFQIRATRDAQGMSQADLAQAVGMSQNNLCRLENPDYGKHTISSLKRIAESLDVALVVRFVPFSQYIKWISSTPFVDCGRSPASMAPASFETEEKNRSFEDSTRYFEVRDGGKPKVVQKYGSESDSTNSLSSIDGNPYRLNAAGGLK